jgi:hypothetical protein
MPFLKKWSVIGRMLFRVKTALAGYFDGWLYFWRNGQSLVGYHIKLLVLCGEQNCVFDVQSFNRGFFLTCTCSKLRETRVPTSNSSHVFFFHCLTCLLLSLFKHFGYDF